MTEAKPRDAGPGRTRVFWSRWRHAGAAPVDGALLAFFRIGFGIVMAWEGWRFIDLDRVVRYYAPLTEGVARFHFTYWPFTFVRPLPEPWMTVQLWVIILAGLAVAVGAWYRTSAVVLWLALTWLFLLDKAEYLNHLYLVVLFATLLPFLPAQRVWSVDAWRASRGARGVGGESPSATVPAWTTWLLRFQVGVPYAFGGLAKLNRDFLRGHPLIEWLDGETGFPIIGPLLDDPVFVIGLAWSALLIDLAVVPLLLRRRTRPWAFAAVCIFHVMNSRLFSIGVFPWLMILATTVFFAPTWPREVLATVRDRSDRRRLPTIAGALIGGLAGLLVPSGVVAVQIAVGAVGGAVSVWHLWRPGADSSEVTALVAPAAAGVVPAERSDGAGVWQRRVGLAMAIVWIATQLVVPLRHWAVPGDVNWTEDGHRLAWRMKLRQKSAALTLFIVDPETGERTEADLEPFLSSRQQSRARTRPDMIVQLAHHLEDRAGRDIAVYADSTARLNDRERQVFVRPDVDLTDVRFPWWGRAHFIAPLDPRD